MELSTNSAMGFIANVEQNLRLPQLCTLLVPKAPDDVIVHHARRLHVGVDNRAAHELESTFFQVFAKRIRFFAGGGNVLRGLPLVLLWSSVYELPDVAVEAIELILHIQKRSSIGNRRIHFQSIANDSRIFERLGDFLLSETSDFLRIEIGKSFPITFALVQNS